MRLPPSSTMATQLVKFSSRAFASAASPMALAAARFNDFFVLSWAMTPSLLGERSDTPACGPVRRRRAAQRDHVERMFGGLDGRGELVAVHAACLHPAFPLDGRLDERIGLAARRNPDFVVEEFR